MRRHLAPGLAALAAAALVGLLAWGLLRDADGAGGEVGSSPPARALPVLGARGEDRSLAAFRGRPVVLNVFASWCGPCKDEAPVLQRAARRGVTVVGVTYNDTEPDARAFARRYALTYPILRDVDESFSRALGVTGIPETFVLDARGRIASVRRGPVDEAFLRRALG